MKFTHCEISFLLLHQSWNWVKKDWFAILEIPSERAGPGNVVRAGTLIYTYFSYMYIIYCEQGIIIRK